MQEAVMRELGSLIIRTSLPDLTLLKRYRLVDVSKKRNEAFHTRYGMAYMHLKALVNRNHPRVGGVPLFVDETAGMRTLSFILESGYSVILLCSCVENCTLPHIAARMKERYPELVVEEQIREKTA